MNMPQIRCPNCGISINLENRRNIDYKLIVHALQKSPRTFTDLLKITHLPRKTLSMRLSALCTSGMVVKDGGYSLNGSSPTTLGERMIEFKGKTLEKPPFLKKKSMLMLVMLLIIGVSLAATSSALFFQYSPPPPEYIGTFKMQLKIYDAVDLFAWQTSIHFNYSQLIVIEEEVIEGDFLAKASPQNGTVFMFRLDKNRPGTLTIAVTLLRDRAGVDGTGVLATITFGYKSQSYDLPEVADEDDMFPTILLRNIPGTNDLKDTSGILKLELGG